MTSSAFTVTCLGGTAVGGGELRTGLRRDGGGGAQPRSRVIAGSNSGSAATTAVDPLVEVADLRRAVPGSASSAGSQA